MVEGLLSPATIANLTALIRITEGEFISRTKGGRAFSLSGLPKIDSEEPRNNVKIRLLIILSTSFTQLVQKLVEVEVEVPPLNLAMI